MNHLTSLEPSVLQIHICNAAAPARSNFLGGWKPSQLQTFISIKSRLYNTNKNSKVGGGGGREREGGSETVKRPQDNFFLSPFLNNLSSHRLKLHRNTYKKKQILQKKCFFISDAH